MKRITTISGILMILFLGTHLIFAQGNDEKNGTTAAQFLKIGAGALMILLGLAMGGRGTIPVFLMILFFLFLQIIYGVTVWFRQELES